MNAMILVDGVWEPWSNWSQCPVTCGGALSHRNRDCHGPFHGGGECIGSGLESEMCNDNPCPGKLDSQQ